MAKYENEIIVAGGEANLHVFYNETDEGVYEGIVRLVWFLEGESEEWLSQEAFELNAFEIENFSVKELEKYFKVDFLKSHIANGGYIARLFIK